MGRMDDLSLARIHCDGMRELIANNPAHWKDEQALDLVRSLCRRAREVITDRASRAYLSAIDDYAAALGPVAEGQAGAKRMFGPDALRREILRELRLLSIRLAELEADRRLAVNDPPQAGARRRERYAAVLREAAQQVGGAPRLAALLEVPVEDLQRWSGAAEAAPLKVFLSALDFVAGGAFPRQPDPLRVAVLRAERQAAVAAVRNAAASTEREMPSWLQAPFGYVLPALALVAAGGLAYHLSHPMLPDAGPEPLRTQAAMVPLVAEPPKIAPKTVAVRKAAPAKPPVVQPKVAPAPELLLAAAEPPVAAPPVVDVCASASGLSWLVCLEKVRREYCAGREGQEPGCPAVIPGSSSN
jgi:hypothetical protein